MSVAQRGCSQMLTVCNLCQRAWAPSYPFCLASVARRNDKGYSWIGVAAGRNQRREGVSHSARLYFCGIPPFRKECEDGHPATGEVKGCDASRLNMSTNQAVQTTSEVGRKSWLEVWIGRRLRDG
jgi:hypothetical protein